MEFLTASHSTEGGDCADAELANTKSDIERIRMGFLDPSRDQDWARFPGQYAVGHPNPLLSVIVCRSSQLESSIAALAPRAPIRLDQKLAAKARATIKLSPGGGACATQNINETAK